MHARQTPSGSSGGAIAFIRRWMASGARPIKHVPAGRLTPDLVRLVEQTKHIRDLFLV